VVLGSKAANQVEEDSQSEGYDTPYVESDVDDLFKEIGSDGEIRQKKDHYRRFKSSDDVPKFELGMKFCGKKEFKEAIIRYCCMKKSCQIHQG